MSTFINNMNNSMLSNTTDEDTVVLTYVYEEEDTFDIFPNPETEIDYDHYEEPDDYSMITMVEDNLAKVDKQRNPALYHHHLSLQFVEEVRLLYYHNRRP